MDEEAIQLEMLYQLLESAFVVDKTIYFTYDETTIRAHHTVFHYFYLNDHEDFVEFTRMSVQQFNFLYQSVETSLMKRSKREPLAPELRLSSVLNYLAHGSSIQLHSWFFRVGVSTMYNLIPKVCGAIFKGLSTTYLSFPNEEDWIPISENFASIWNIPNCVGALDGRHIRIRPPPNSGSLFLNYKTYNSIVLMALCDAHQRFIWANVGDYGSKNDAGIFRESDFGSHILRDEINFPEPAPLPGTNNPVPFFIIGDGGFPLKKNLMKPYTKCAYAPIDERIFSYRLSRARRIIECAFGTTFQKWRVFELSLGFKLSTTETMTLAVLCMHNFIITTELNYPAEERLYLGENSDVDLDPVDVEIDYYNEDINAMQVRQALTNYFMSDIGSVPWQWKYIK